MLSQAQKIFKEFLKPKNFEKKIFLNSFNFKNISTFHSK